MTNSEYRVAQAQVLTLVRQLQELPLLAMHAAITHVHSVDPVLNPTLYKLGMQNLRDIARIVGALRDAQAITQRPLADLRRRVAEQLAESGMASLLYWEALAE